MSGNDKASTKNVKEPKLGTGLTRHYEYRQRCAKHVNASWSADPGDYWYHDDAHAFACDICGLPVDLERRAVIHGKHGPLYVESRWEVVKIAPTAGDLRRLPR